MNKTILLSAIATLALLTSACGTNNASPNNPTGTTHSQSAPRTLNNYDRAGSYGTDNLGVYDRTGTTTNRNNGTTLNGQTRGTGMGAFTPNGAGGGNGYTTTTGIRNYSGNNGRTSIYSDRHMTTASANQNQYGFSYLDGTQVRNDANVATRVYVDRNALAHAVGSVTASVPGVNSSTVLVTDEEVFVGLQTNGQNNTQIKSQARLSALSVAPRYYKVYLTDNPQMVSEMSRVASQSTNTANQDQNVENLVRRFGGLADGDEMRNRGTGMNTNVNGTANQGNGNQGNGNQGTTGTARNTGTVGSNTPYGTSNGTTR